MTSPEDNAALWTPSPARVARAEITAFMRDTEKKTGQSFPNYRALRRWSVDELETFWSLAWDFCGVIGEKGSIPLLVDEGRMRRSRFFPEAQINYAENLLRRRDDAPALIFRAETGDERALTFHELYNEVSRWRQALEAAGVQEGDRVAACMPNMPETIIAMLAVASMGALWASASPDFGVQGLVDRFGQVEPKVLIAVDGYYYNGKQVDCLEKLSWTQGHVKSLKQTIIVPFLKKKPDLSKLKNAVLQKEFLALYKPQDIAFKRLPFDHPLFIMFSSGTTGVPKCIVHGHGGTILQHMKEHKLQCDIKKDDKVFYFTTCSWMMWNWLVSALASEATLLLYDGSPFYPGPDALWDYTVAHGCTFFGTGAKYIDALKAEGVRPGDTHDLSALRTMASTGSPLVHESFEYVYDAIKDHLHLASISGGTDIVSCFVLGNPVSPVYRGEIQGAGLGMAVEIFDEDGEALPPGAGSGELVCVKPFPSMPVMFWGDKDHAKYREAYFARFDNVWCHGDWIERTENGGYIIHGRSDATLNPGGVRIGTAEIYRQVENIPQVLESIAVGQDWEGDSRVILFVILRDDEALDAALEKTIKTAIRTGASPRHVPAKIIQVTAIPRTKSGKITELAVRDVIHGRKVKNVEALANPEALELYQDLEALRG